jgi:hypothetical protein
MKPSAILGLVLSLIPFALAFSVGAQTPTPAYSLIGLTNTFWRYDSSGGDLGTGWREVNYDDAPWALGRGVLARENNPLITPLTNTVLALTSSNGSVVTHYSRAHFTLTNDPRAVLIVASNLVDDGCVVYVNGREAYRLNMSDGMVDARTLAPQSAVEGGFLVTTIPPDFLQAGVNLIAAELHQLNNLPDDAVFGLSLTATFPPAAPINITSQPETLALEEGKPALFQVGVAGWPAFFQWHRDGIAIPGAASNPLYIPSAGFGNAGNFSVIVTNGMSSVTSAVAVLTVLPDVRGPVLLQADGGTVATNVLATFSEPVLPAAATNVSSYGITNTSGGTLAISQAVLQDGSNVLLTTSAPRVPGFNYLLSVSNVRDASPHTNLIASNSLMPIASSVLLVSFTNQWKVHIPFPPFDPLPPDLGTAWREFTYADEAQMDDGFGIFYSSDGSLIPGPTGSAVEEAPSITSYFRTRFNLQASPVQLKFELTHVIDDGGILYLNGAEFLRYNMPVGTVDYLTRPATTLGDATRVGPHWFTLPSYRVGTNVLAGEVHQPEIFDVDRVFGSELAASVQSYVTGPVVITGGPSDLVVEEGSPAVFRVMAAGGATLQWRQNDVAILGATNPVYVIPSASLGFNGSLFRVAVSNATSGNISTNARLFVAPDITPPRLLAAAGGAGNAILLTFSEPLEAASATLLANYQITNAVGSSATLTSATLTNGTNVVLTFNAPLLGSLTVLANNVRDASTAHNLIATNSSVPVSADYFIPMTSAWRYLLTNTNAVVQASFMQPGYDDSGWRGPSNALLSSESAALPAPKNTPLPEYADPPSNLQPIPTFYFRQQFYAPVVSSGAVIQLRHIIDDGMVLHLNGQEIYRFNMPDGPVSAETPSASTIGDATLLGPFTIGVTNLVGGTNILAVEVHQARLGDVVMGLELSIHVPGSESPAPVNPSMRRPSLRRFENSNSESLFWIGPGFLLEKAASVTGPWLPVSAIPPYLLAPTNTAGFFRLRHP